ncbi:MAG TPA: DUF1028 domain-containing protein [Acetobacteraceae bacterium]|nr:DUF1028 domain-containing protein [Acetobacteraceae bacterium]
MTFSIVARCPRSGRFAVAVASSSPAVAARCAHARAGVGAVTTQNVTDPRLGPQMLELMQLGASAREAVDIVRRSAPHIEHRQLTAVDKDGATAGFSGERALGCHASAEGRNAVAAGNLLADPGVPQVMVEAFQAGAAEGDLGDLVIAAMQAGLAAGGEAGPIRSAGFLLVDRVAWHVADLRVDWHEEPLAELARLWQLWRPQMQAYVDRALDPAAAPAYGVPGDE